MSEIHKKLYGVEQSSDEEIRMITNRIKKTFDQLNVGVEEVEPVSFELFAEGMKALTAAGFTNFREMDQSAFNVWHDTLKGLGDSLFSFTVQRLVRSGRQEFRTGRLLLGDVIDAAEAAYNETLLTLKETAENEDSPIPPRIRFFEATKKLGLPRYSPSAQVHMMLINQTLPSLSNSDLLSIPTPRASPQGLEIGDYEPAVHKTGDLF